MESLDGTQETPQESEVPLHVRSLLGHSRNQRGLHTFHTLATPPLPDCVKMPRTALIINFYCLVLGFVAAVGVQGASCPTCPPSGTIQIPDICDCTKFIECEDVSASEAKRTPRRALSVCARCVRVHTGRGTKRQRIRTAGWCIASARPPPTCISLSS